MTKIGFLLITIFSSVASLAVAQSGTITEAYIGCLTSEDLDLLSRAISNNDTRLRDSLMGTKCVVVKGYEYSILDRGILTSKVRIYVGSQTIDLIVPSEAVR